MVSPRPRLRETSRSPLPLHQSTIRQFNKGKQGVKRKFSPDPDQENNEKNAVAFHIGGERYAVVKRFKGRVFVNLREYYVKEGTSKLLAGKKGLNLTSDEWRELAMQGPNITAAIDYVSSSVIQQ